MGSTNEIQNSIITAVENIASTYVSRLEVDKTIKATIVRCYDATTGAYEVRFNGGIMRAYVEDSDVSYEPNTLVYVLVPRGNFSERKVIRGRVAADDTFIYVTSILDGYSPIGASNFVTPINVTNTELSGGFPLHTLRVPSQSGAPNDSFVLYDRSRSDNKIEVDNEALKEAVIRGDAILFSADIRTNLPFEQRTGQLSGNYGINFNLVFEADNVDPVNPETIEIPVSLDVYNMVGNPYILPTFTEQFRLCQDGTIISSDSLNLKKFLYVDEISIFCKDFKPNESQQDKETIWIKNIGIQSLEAVGEEMDNGYKLSVTFPDGSYFKKTDANNKILRAHAELTHNNIDNLSNDSQWYWFKKNSLVSDTTHPKYHTKGGIGWELVSDTTKNDFNISKESATAFETEYKVVADYKGMFSLYKRFTIINDSQRRTIVITSSQGVNVSSNTSTLLTASILEENTGGEQIDVSDSYNFRWFIITSTSNSQVELMPEAISTLTPYYEAVDSAANNIIDNDDWSQNNINTYNIATNNLRIEESNAKTMVKTEQKKNYFFVDVETVTLPNLQQQGSTVDVRRYRYDRIPSSKRYVEYYVNNSATIICTVYDSSGNDKGSASITLANSQIVVPDTNHVVIGNGNQIFQYDENGISPAHVQHGTDAQTIWPLSAVLRTPQGDEIYNVDIRWEIPTANTLLVQPAGIEGTPGVGANGQSVMVYHIDQCTFGIADVYNPQYRDNQIVCIITYQDVEYRGATNFFFTKIGENGTNGTDIICRPGLKIVNTTTQETIESDNSYLHYVYINEGYAYWHWKGTDGIVRDSAVGDVTLTTVAYSKGVEVLSSKIKSSKWELKSRYFSISGNHLVYTANPSSAMLKNSPYSLTLKNTLTIDIGESQEKIQKYYTFYPFPVVEYTVNSPDNYKVEFDAANTLRYVTYNSSGYLPSYPTDAGVKLESPELGTPQWATDWSYAGGKDDNEITADLSLDYVVSTTEGVPASIATETDVIYPYAKVIPNTFYSGENTNNAVLCDLYTKNNQQRVKVAHIIVPIHMSLNRYELISLNEWDGNSVVVNEEDEYILAPQVGAGSKNDSNQFTGLLMGTRTRTDPATNNPVVENGLFGYKDGAQSIFLNADDGSAHFGTPNDNDVSVNGMIEFYPYEANGKRSHIGNWYIGNHSLYNIYNRKFNSPTEGKTTFVPVTSQEDLPPYSSSNPFYNDSGPYVAGAELGISPNQTGAIFNSRPSYLSMKSKALGVTNYGTLVKSGTSDDVNWSNTANLKLTPGDSIEVEIDPTKTSVFTVYRHYFKVEAAEGASQTDVNSISSTVRQKFFPHALEDMPDEDKAYKLTADSGISDYDKYTGKWYRKPIVGINNNGEFYSNAVENGNTNVTVGSIGAFGLSANSERYKGVRFADSGVTVGKMFIDKEETSKTLYITTGNSASTEIPNNIAVIGKSVGLYAPQYADRIKQPSDMTLQNSLIVNTSGTNITHYKNADTSFSYKFGETHTESTTSFSVQATKDSSINIGNGKLTIANGSADIQSAGNINTTINDGYFYNTIRNNAASDDNYFGIHIADGENKTQLWLKMTKNQLKVERWGVPIIDGTNYYYGLYYNQGDTGFSGFRSKNKISLQSLKNDLMAVSRGTMLLAAYQPVSDDATIEQERLTRVISGGASSNALSSRLSLKAEASGDTSFSLTSVRGYIESGNNIKGFSGGAFSNSLFGVRVATNLEVPGQAYIQDQLSTGGAIVANKSWVYTKGLALLDATEDFTDGSHYVVINKAWVEGVDSAIGNVNNAIGNIGNTINNSGFVVHGTNIGDCYVLGETIESQLTQIFNALRGLGVNI